MARVSRILGIIVHVRGASQVAVLLCAGVLSAGALASDDEPTLLPIPGLPRPVPTEMRDGQAEPPSSNCRRGTLAMQRDRMPFGPGELLNYDIAYFGVRTGKVSLRVGDKSTVDKITTYPLHAQVKTDGVLDVLGNLDARMVSFLDPATMLPSRMVNRVVTRGGAFSPSVTTSREDGAFNALRTTATGPIGGEVNARLERTSASGTLKKRARISTDADVVDGLSVIYYLRARQLVDGQPFCFELYHRRRLWRVNGKVGAVQSVSVPIGQRQARRLDATITLVGHAKEAPPVRNVTAWLSADADRVPLLVSTPEKVGTIEVRLVSFVRGRNLVATERPVDAPVPSTAMPADPGRPH